MQEHHVSTQLALHDQKLTSWRIIIMIHAQSKAGHISVSLLSQGCSLK